MTICIQCVHHRCRGSDVWYNHFCTNPKYEHPLGIDPVTGKKCYWAKNDLGQTITSGKHPSCRNMNEGDCKGFKQG